VASGAIVSLHTTSDASNVEILLSSPTPFLPRGELLADAKELLGVDVSKQQQTSDWGAETLSTFTAEHCWRLLGADRGDIECALDGPELAVEGTLWGGNLAMLAHLAGTPHLPGVDGGILFLEDIGEVPYRIERMLYQLHFAGILARQKAVLLGEFNGYNVGPNDNGHDLASVIAQARGHFRVPIVTGLPFGHCPDKLTLPVGGHCVLRVSAGAGRLTLSDYDVGR